MEYDSECILRQRLMSPQKQKPASVPRYYPVKPVRKSRKPPGIPKCASWGWNDYHLALKFLIVSVFLAFVSLTTPFWAYAGSKSFGLWLYCDGSECTSIHDNLVERKDVPAWYHMTQGSFCIGTVAALVGLGILVNNCVDNNLKMTATVHRMCVCVLGISVLQTTVALFTFVKYFEHTDFLYYRFDYMDSDIDFHGSFYCGVVSVVMTGFSMLMVLLDEDITRATSTGRYYRHHRVAPAYTDATPRYMFDNGKLPQYME